MTDARAWLDQVDARTNAATDGPWRADSHVDMSAPGYEVYRAPADGGYQSALDDAEYATQIDRDEAP